MPAALPLVLDRATATPLTTQLSGQVRQLVQDGALTVGDRLPGSRALAAELRCSRAVVEHAYDQLVAEGWLETRRGAGTFVAAPRLPRPPRRQHRALPSTTRSPVHLDAGTPWIDPRHGAGWRRAWREVSAARPPRGYDDPCGLPELRALLAERLGRTRGMRVGADDVLVTIGTTDGLRHLLTALPGAPDRPVVVEDPGYRAAVETVRNAGRPITDMPAGQVLDLAGAAAVYVTPAHQHPLGRVMPAAERLELLAAARAAGCLVVEDDYDSEFRYDVAPVPALATLDPEQVAYLGTASKTVAPSLRLGWLVAPAEVRERVVARRTLTHDAAAWPVQRAFVTLLRDGYVDAVVRSARRVYADRAPRVAAALSPYATLGGPLAGMYSTWLLPQEAAVRAHDAALAAGFRVGLLADYCRSVRLTGLVVGFGGVTDTELDAALAALVGALAEG